jgi:PII-like signaling protein
MIFVSVASGCSDSVVEAAREAGARGGTVLRGLRNASEFAQEHMGISLQEEQEFVMMVVKKESKSEIMRAISERCGLCTESHGIVLSLPVDEVLGLEG